MNEMLPSADPSKLRGQKAAKKSRIRAINQGMRYEIPGNLRRLACEIERGERGDVRNAVLILSQENLDPKSASIDCMHWGTGTVADAHWMLSTAKNRVEPA